VVSHSEGSQRGLGASGVRCKWFLKGWRVRVIGIGGVVSRRIEGWLRLEEEAREVRRKQADWKFIESQPPRLRIALRLYVEAGDLFVASRVAGLTVEEFNELRKRARIPNVC